MGTLEKEHLKDGSSTPQRKETVFLTKRIAYTEDCKCVTFSGQCGLWRTRIDRCATLRDLSCRQKTIECVCMLDRLPLKRYGAWWLEERPKRNSVVEEAVVIISSS